MQLFYKIFLALFVIFIGFNLYKIDYSLGFFSEENATYVISLCAAILGIIILLVLNKMSKLGVKK